MTATASEVARARRAPSDRKPAASTPPAAFNVEAAAAAAAAEAKSEPFLFELRGQTFALPPANEWSIDVSDYLARNEVSAALRAMLGEDQWDDFSACKPTLGEANAIIEGMSERYGVESAGN